MATLRHRKRLGDDLAGLRRESGMSQREVAERLGRGWHQSRVARLEAGKQQRDLGEPVTQLLDLYDVQGEERVRLLRLAQPSTHAGWWTAYNDVFHSSSYVPLEDEARLIRSWQDAVIPGLLQTEAYARALIGVVADLRGETSLVQRRVEARMLRRTLLQREHPPHLHAVIDEAVLHRQVGGPAAMQDQLIHLEAMARRPNVTIQLMPYDVGAHPGTEGRFVILSFDADSPDIPFIESQAGSVYLEAADEIQRLNLTWERVTAAALSVDDSLEVLVRLAKDDR
ncbi:helix-turn-helix domain-containing protein [Actinomadura rupiterrae]|uniref:helix-turn-helix domain-containing protein n=1 Tax=Actinomadura rupiterrae TaxID=559627 RepID=UPI0020A25384|nr:helix-turn-helix transcriptional regulator [Actinomadura rupiterrae]MCP2343565.1 transcriptional regulator with XRE-family HTH domain [Actinomadura rupiterrae]